VRDFRLNDFEQELVEMIPRLRRFARSLTRDAVEADDLCQAAIEKALRHQKRKRSDARLDGWLFMIARNHWLDSIRRIRREGEIVMPFDGADNAIAKAAVDEDPIAAMTIHQVMNKLPPDQLEAAALVWVEGYSYKEAAGLLKIPIGTLTSRLSRARTRLLAQMEAI
jgi:RNA polymerase sigma factor (sigma-70 family)